MRGVREDLLPDAVARCYEAAARPGLWREALHEVSRAAGSEGAILLYGQATRDSS